MKEFKLPDWGEGIHEGEIIKWHVKINDYIKEDEPLVDVETDKAAVTIPSPFSGKVVDLIGNPGDTVYTGQVIARFEDSESTKHKSDNITEQKTNKYTDNQKNAKVSDSHVSETPAHLEHIVHHKVPASPATRRLARELGIDINKVPPTGKGGRVTTEDVKSYALKLKDPAFTQQLSKTANISEIHDKEEISAACGEISVGSLPYFVVEPMPDFSKWGPVESLPLKNIRKKIAQKMVVSTTIIPHVAHFDEVNITKLQQVRQKINETSEVKVTLLAFVMKAAVFALKKYPMFNSSLDFTKNEIILKKYYNIGFAADTERGLVVPVIKDVDKKSIKNIAIELKSLSDQARSNNIDPSHFKGGTFTITNIGSLGGVGMFPIINYPEAAILGMCKSQKKPIVEDDKIVIAEMLPLALVFDHRIADGADAARFVNEIKIFLSEPENFILNLY